MSIRLEIEKQKRLKGVTYEELATFCGCSRYFLYLLLRGKKESRPTLDKLKRFFEGGE